MNLFIFCITVKLLYDYFFYSGMQACCLFPVPCQHCGPSIARMQTFFVRVYTIVVRSRAITHARIPRRLLVRLSVQQYIMRTSQPGSSVLRVLNASEGTFCEESWYNCTCYCLQPCKDIFCYGGEYDVLCSFYCVASIAKSAAFVVLRFACPRLRQHV